LSHPLALILFPVVSAREMYDTVMEKINLAHIIIKTAAVADYRPEETFSQKLKKGDDLILKLVRNPDILKEIGSKKGKAYLVGFAAETENLLDNARKK
jgi:phosphopantothenoylcysteine decarboxylase / phosphopantothenate---cysteine ligase